MTRGAEVGGGDEVLVIWQSCLMEEPVTLEETIEVIKPLQGSRQKNTLF